MKIFIILSLLAITSFARVHEFHAENNFICTLCKETLNLVNQNDVQGVEKVFEQFPELKNRLLQVTQNESPEQACIEAKLCDDGSVLLEDERVLDHETIINQVNSNPESTWVAGVNTRFVGMKIKDIKKMMGTVVDSKWTYKGAPKRSFTLKMGLPTSFDVRTNWPQCSVVSGHVRDQSNCGSCWAHGTTEAFNDRLCIKTNGTFNTLLSVADTTACCAFLNCFSQGCNGGQVGTPWAFFDKTGVVTGGDFGDKQTCYPYTMPQCAHHVNASLPDCSTVTEVDPKCDKTCPGNSATYSSDKQKAKSSYGFSSVNAIKQDLVSYGSVTAAFTVYEDFVSYKSGIYKHTTGSALGGHAVKIVGYGTENGQDYWVVMNSWNPTWGDNGQFKIAVGDSGIDSQCHAGLV